MAAREYDIEIDQGADFVLILNLKVKDIDGNLVPMSLTGYIGKAQVRKRPGGKLVAELTVTISDPPTSGIVTVSLTKAQTLLLPDGEFLYDLELNLGDVSKKILRGKANIIAEVTRDDTP